MFTRRYLFILAAIFHSLFAHAGWWGSPEKKEWRWYLGDQHSTQYSRLDQISVKNVAKLEPVWTYHSGGEAQIQTNPIVTDGLLYGVSADRKVFALEADTGREVWVYKPEHAEGTGAVVRGLLYWADRDDKRIYATVEHHLYALDARTGVPVASFGEGGAIDIKTAYDRDVSKLHIGSTSPGVIFGNTLIMSVRVSEGHPAAPGDILAFNVLTGAREWVFHTIPHPGEFGYDTWPPDAWKTVGGANCWAGMSLDAKRGIVYIPTGSPAFDFYGADRIGANLFANSLLALDAATGKRIWHFQAVHHDLWDRDLPAPPNLVTVRHNGRKRDAVAQITKSAHVFLFDRDTGEPLFPIEEVPVPASDVPGEEAWPTQPIPVKPPAFQKQAFTEDMVTTRTPEAHTYALDRLRRARTGEPFIPPSLDGSVVFPGFDGGGEWGGAAFDPKSGMLYVNASVMPWITTLYEVRNDIAEGPNGVAARVYAQNCIYCHGPDLKGDPLQEFPPLSDLKTKYTADEMATIVRQGRERMPSFGHLTDDEVKAVTQFLFDLDARQLDTMGAIAQPETAPPPGERWFTHTGYHRFVDPDGYPAIQPPWGTLTAIDLNEGEIVWRVPLGTFPELAEQGLTNTGTENYGGPIVTAGGLVFIAATKDNCIRAFDKETGEELWKAPLPRAGYATPCTYEIDGRQYLAVAAAGGKIGSDPGDAYLAFALPRIDRD
jgi:quinoprotein glucose dehydrogenase